MQLDGIAQIQIKTPLKNVLWSVKVETILVTLRTTPILATVRAILPPMDARMMTTIMTTMLIESYE